MRFLYGADRRVLVHHSVAGSVAGSDKRFPLSRRGGGQRYHDIPHAIHDTRLRACIHTGGETPAEEMDTQPEPHDLKPPLFFQRKEPVALVAHRYAAQHSHLHHTRGGHSSADVLVRNASDAQHTARGEPEALRRRHNRNIHYNIHIALPQVYSDEEEPQRGNEEAVEREPQQPPAADIHGACACVYRCRLHLLHHPSRVRLRASADDNDSHSGGDTDGNVTRTEAEEHPPGAYVHTEPALTRHRGTGARPPQTAIRGTPARPRYPHRRLRDSRGVAMDGKDTYGTAPAQPLRRSCEQYSARQAAHKHPVGNNDSLSWRQPAGDRQRRTTESAERRHRGRDVQRRPRDREARDEAAASDNNGYKPVPQQDADGKRNTRQIQLYGCGT